MKIGSLRYWLFVVVIAIVLSVIYGIKLSYDSQIKQEVEMLTEKDINHNQKIFDMGLECINRYSNYYYNSDDKTPNPFTDMKIAYRLTTTYKDITIVDIASPDKILDLKCLRLKEMKLQIELLELLNKPTCK